MRSLAVVLVAVGALAFAGKAHAGVPITKPKLESIQTLIQKNESRCFSWCMANRGRCFTTKSPAACCTMACRGR
jgi:hypothetical protein